MVFEAFLMPCGRAGFPCAQHLVLVKPFEAIARPFNPCKNILKTLMHFAARLKFLEFVDAFISPFPAYLLRGLARDVQTSRSKPTQTNKEEQTRKNDQYINAYMLFWTDAGIGLA